jgi:hypothetical protein
MPGHAPAQSDARTLHRDHYRPATGIAYHCKNHPGDQAHPVQLAAQPMPLAGPGDAKDLTGTNLIQALFYFICPVLG